MNGFSPVMQIADYIPELQGALRNWYPEFEKTSEHSVQIQPGNITVSASDRWSFISANKKSAVVISHERLWYVTAEYPRFDGFSDTCEEVIATLVNILEPGLLLRIGLRYGDLVIIGENEKVADLIDEHFIFPQCIESLGSSQQQSTEMFLNTDQGVLTIKTLYGHHNFRCLPDIQGLPIAIGIDDVPGERIILDFDHVWENKEESIPFTTDEITERLGSLHETSRDAFWKITTDYARNKKWA